MSIFARNQGLEAEGPTPADLAAIEAEWPVISAELAVLDCQITILSHRGRPSELDHRRYRRAVTRLLNAMSAPVWGEAA